MLELEKKLSVLADIARVLNENQVVWAVGGSLLLYFKGKTETFHDLDLMVYEDDVEKAKELLLRSGELAEPDPDTRYRTRHFLEFTIDGVDVDVLGGFVIVNDGKEYDCALRPEQVAEYVQVEGESIPLQSLSDWRRYYQLMGREEKVRMIDA